MKKIMLVMFLVGCSSQGPIAPPNPLCGEDGEVFVPMIVNGDETDMFPEVGTSHSFDLNQNDKKDCTCTLIGKQTALTAAHCVGSDPNKSYIKLDGRSTDDLMVDKYIVHPKDDIAIIILKEEVKGIAPAALSYSPPQNDDNIVLLGYGDVDGKSDNITAPKKLMFGCNYISSISYNTFNYSGATGRGDICDGDSGGPTIIYGLVAGVHVYSSFNPTGECGKGSSTDMRIDYYLDWILNNSPDKINVGKIERY